MKIAPLPEKDKPKYPVLVTAVVTVAALATLSCHQQKPQQSRSIMWGSPVENR